MVNAPYPMHSTPTPLPQRPHPPPHVPSSTSTPSRQDLLSPSSSSASLSVPTPGANAVSNAYLTSPSPPPSNRLPYYPPLPWYSFTEGTFPPRGPRRRRRKLAPLSSSAPVELPAREDPPTESQPSLEPNLDFPPHTTPQEGRIPQSNLETPSTSHAPSEAESTQPTTPSSAKTPIPTRPQIKPNNKSTQKPNVPIVPIVPVIPNISLAPRASKQTSPSVVSDTANILQPSNADHLANAVQAADKVNLDVTSSSAIHTPSPNKAAPKSWADLVKAKATPASSNAIVPADSSMSESNGLHLTKPGSLAAALRSFSANSKDTKIAFVEPRGLVNTGNMCYMNSVLQMLVFCVPFYDFLDRISKQAAYSFKNETPLVDAM
ncbi:MAG: hypothetical protein Q9167_001379 [Letrouitia subvulpina]